MKNKLAAKEGETKTLENERNTTQKELNHSLKELEPLKNETKRLYQDAKLATNGISPGKQGWDAIGKEFSKLPPTEEELFEEMKNLNAKLYCLHKNSNNEKNVSKLSLSSRR